MGSTIITSLCSIVVAVAIFMVVHYRLFLF